MSFRLPKDTREYFKLMDNRSDEDGFKLKIMFDKYYLCLMLGLDKAKLGSEDDLEPATFIDQYPVLYSENRNIILGLLIDAEMRRRGILSEDKDRIESLMLEIIDENSSTKLNENGMNLMNCYAVKGMEIIRDKIIRTSELETFLIHYYDLFNIV